MSGGIFSRVFESARHSSNPFIRAPARNALTYEKTIALSGRFANALAALGVRRGNRVAIQVEKSSEALIVYLACLRAGAVYLPLNNSYTPNEVGYFLQDAEPRLLICDPAWRDKILTVAQQAGVRRVETLGTDGSGTLPALAASLPEAFDPMPCAADDLAAILYTSGTTGRSKGAVLTHGNLLSNAEALVESWRFTAADVLVHALPIFHTHGLFVATNTILLAGASMIFLPRFDTQAVLAALPQATVLMGVPTFYSRLLASPSLTADLVRRMRLFISGSAPLSAETHREFLDRTGHAILERYGMTETGMNTSNPLDGERRAGTVGFPLPGVELRIVDPEGGAETTPGDVGVIEVRGPNVCRGYWRNPEKTASDFRDGGFFITGDLARIDPEGYVHIVGRAKDLIISGGLNVYPAEIEAAIDAVPGVAESAVIGVPHPDLGEGVTGIVAARPDATLDPEAVRTALVPVLARYKIPKRIIMVGALPRNAMGKVQKNELRQEYWSIYQELGQTNDAELPVTDEHG